jgi:cytochrome c-type biogenesis protein CcmH/NrfG
MMSLPWVAVALWILVVVLWCVGQLWWTHQHAKNLDRHSERMERIYVDHVDRLKEL